jgi:DNA-binding NarL/FixJ family response regulator
MSPYIANRVLKLFQQFAPSVQKEDEMNALGSREKEVLLLMTEGHNLPAIADKICVSYETVRTHVKRIYKKFHVTSASEAVAKAIKQRLL